MPEFKAGTREEVESGAAQYTNTATFISEGSPAPIVPNKTSSRVGFATRTIRSRSRVKGKLVFTTRTVVDKTKPGPRIYHRTVVYPVKNSSGAVTGSKRVLYIEKNGTYQPAAVSTDGGASYSFSDPQFPTMAGVAGADLQRDLNTSGSAINKDIDKTVADEVRTNQAILPADRAVLIDSEKNTETKDPVPPPSGPTPTDGDRSTEPGPQPAQFGTSESISENAGTRDKFPGGGVDGAEGSLAALTYPLSLKDSKQDKMQFNMIKYVAPGLDNSNFGSPPRQQQFRDEQIIGRVFLPIPNGITDTTGASWGEGTITPLQASLAQVAMEGISQGATGAIEALKDQVDKVAGNSADVKTALQTTIAGDAAGVQGLLTRTTGAILNPNLELLFQKPTLRPFDFTFKMSARSAKEADEIIKIIRFFKQGMAPIRSASNLFIKSPHTFKIRYIHDGGDHPFLNKFKECALKNMTVNYTPEGNYATFRDGKMISYQITMSFQELEPVFNDDYGNSQNAPDTELGF